MAFTRASAASFDSATHWIFAVICMVVAAASFTTSTLPFSLVTTRDLASETVAVRSLVATSELMRHATGEISIAAARARMSAVRMVERGVLLFMEEAFFRYCRATQPLRHYSHFPYFTTTG
ncbi:MAG: hypothetical protein LW625_10105 [Planctomycetaceae bacterium]|nr:hypothetical protein [Planctomycetaceae bacterium]